MHCKILLATNFAYFYGYKNDVLSDILLATFHKFIKLRLRLVHVKAFPENISFSGNAIFRKGKCIQVFGCVGICFTENQFRCLVCTNILRTNVIKFTTPTFPNIILQQHNNILHRKVVPSQQNHNTKFYTVIPLNIHEHSLNKKWITKKIK